MPQKANMLTAWEQNLQVGPFHTITRAEVWLDPRDSHEMSKGKNPQYMLAKSQLEQLASAADINVIKSTRLPSSCESIVIWQVEIELSPADDKKRRTIKTYELDLRLKDVDGVDGSYIIQARGRKVSRMKKILNNPSWRKPWEPELDDADGWARWVEEGAMEEYTMTNRHRIRRAETGAWLAAIRSQLRIKNTYTVEEIKTPFVIYRSNIDLQRALTLTGPIGDFARASLGASFANKLGLDEGTVAGFLTAMSGQPEDSEDEIEELEDLFPADAEDIDKLVSDMIELGFPDRGACDGRAMDIFGCPLSQFTRRHVEVMRDGLAILTIGAKSIEGDDLAAFKEHIVDVMQLVYAQGDGTIDELMEERWWNKLYGDDDKEESAEEESDDEELSEESEEEEETVEDGKK